MSDPRIRSAQIRHQEHLARMGKETPLGLPPAGKALVTGRCDEGCRLLRLWPAADGWLVLLDAGRVPTGDLDAILPRRPDGPESHGRHMRGKDVLLDRDPTAWRDGEIRVGCQHGAGLAPIEPVAEAIAAMYEGGRHVAPTRVCLHVRRASGC